MKFAANLQGVTIEGLLDTPEKIRRAREKLIDETEMTFQKLAEASLNSSMTAREIVLD